MIIHILWYLISQISFMEIDSLIFFYVAEAVSF